MATAQILYDVSIPQKNPVNLKELEYLAFSGQYERVHAIFKRIPAAEREKYANKYILNQVVWGSILKLRKLLGVQAEDAAEVEKAFIDEVVKLFIDSCKTNNLFPKELFQTLLFWSDELVKLSLADEAVVLAADAAQAAQSGFGVILSGKVVGADFPVGVPKTLQGVFVAELAVVPGNAPDDLNPFTASSAELMDDLYLFAHQAVPPIIRVGDDGLGLTAPKGNISKLPCLGYQAEQGYQAMGCAVLYYREIVKACIGVAAGHQVLEPGTERFPLPYQVEQSNGLGDILCFTEAHHQIIAEVAGHAGPQSSFIQWQFRVLVVFSEWINNFGLGVVEFKCLHNKPPSRLRRAFQILRIIIL